jgi:hypothetical protein
MTDMSVIMENWNRSLNRMELLNDKDYVENVLGLAYSLNESTQNNILEQQLLLEGFWDTLKSLPGKMKELMLTVQTMTSNPGRIKTYLVFITESVSEKLQILQSFLDKIRGFVKNFPSFQEIIDVFISAVNNPVGAWLKMKDAWWKGTVGLGVVVVLNMIVKKLKAMAWETLSAEDLLKAIGENLWENLKELAGEQVISALMDAASGGVTRFAKILIDAVGKVADVLEPLEPVFDLIKDSEGQVVLSKAAKNLGLTETLIK